MPDAPRDPAPIEATCCVVGGGPAGMMLGFLLARAGVDVVVLEKHADFLRDFRGDTIHPSTLRNLDELGLLDDFLERPHQEARVVTGVVGGVAVPVADFTHLPTRAKFLAFMPQWDFLDFLAEHARAYPTFRLETKAEVTDLIADDQGTVIGVKAKTPDGPVEVKARLTVGADGRRSTVRDRAGLPVRDLGGTIDVLWFRIPRVDSDPDQPLGRFDLGKILVLLFRGDYWQCGYLVPKGSHDEATRGPIEALRAGVAEVAPFLADRVDHLASWDDVKLLSVTVDRLETWHKPGLLLLGDAAHAMSPIGGVGINLAIQDAVAAANLLAEPLRNPHRGPLPLSQLKARRMFPTRATQALQVLVTRRVLAPSLAARKRLPLPWALRLLRRFPRLRRIPARVIGLGFRSEHIRTRDHFARS